VTTILVSEARGVRSLHFGSPWVQGAMRIARPWALELEYTRELMLPLLLRGEAPWPRSVLQVGLGAASVTRYLWRHWPQARLQVVEISPEVIATARQSFKLPEDPARLAIVQAEAHEWLSRHRGRYDLIVVDGFDEKGRAGMLDSVPFYLNAVQRLTREGMLSVNLLTRRKSAAPSVERMQQAFGERVLELAPSEAGNVVLVAATGPRITLGREELRDRAEALRRTAALNLLPTVARLLARHRQVDL
jgi:spermidine synthase